MQTEKVQLTKEKETLLATLYARALESRSPDPILRDPLAEEAVRRIDYNFERLKVDTLSIAIRAKQFDLWTTDRVPGGSPGRDRPALRLWPGQSSVPHQSSSRHSLARCRLPRSH